MRNSQRLLAFAVFAAFAVALASAFAAPDRLARNAGPAAAALLPAAHANPVDVSIQDTLRKGETISELLRRVQLAEEEAGAVLAQLQEFQDPRRMRPGAVISYRRSYVDGSVRGVAFTLDDYLDGRTPSPCIDCNSYVKFGALLGRAGQDRLHEPLGGRALWIDEDRVVRARPLTNAAARALLLVDHDDAVRSLRRDGGSRYQMTMLIRSPLMPLRRRGGHACRSRSRRSTCGAWGLLFL